MLLLQTRVKFWKLKKTYCKSLYSPKQLKTDCQESAHAIFWQSWHLKTIGWMEKYVKARYQLRRSQKCLTFSFKENKVPGNDGLLAEFYKISGQSLIRQSDGFVQHAQLSNQGIWSTSQRQAIVRLLLRKIKTARCWIIGDPSLSWTHVLKFCQKP